MPECAAKVKIAQSLAANKARDGRVTRRLRRMGWWVVRIWEHELARRNEARLVRRMKLVIGDS
jgi:DNA mismatch endonuclease (patch repair protein)